MISVKHGSADVAVELASVGTVAELKERLEAATGVFARHQKLIFKGKVLEDKAALEACKVGAGAKLMMLVSTSAGQAPQKQAAAAPPPPRVAGAKRPTPLATGSLSGGGPRASATAASSSSSSRGAAAAGGVGLQLSSLAERRQNWSKMGACALRDLALEEVPPACFEDLPGIKGADLSQNRLTAVPSSIGRLSSLASLRLADNRLGDGGVPWDALAQLRGLTLLTLDRNALTRLPVGLSGCSGLVRLSASANALAAVEEGSLAGLAALRELDLSDNALKALPAAIGGLSSLEDLNACGNQVAEIPGSVTRLGRLQSLRLDNNRVKTLPEGIFTACTNLAALWLRGNPITVDALRTAPGFASYEARRRARTNKQLDGRVMSDIERAFCEGADVHHWQHFK
ncbi:hypothetical protein Rsub_06661 [Raphidocelis subcapitata]|uniref:Ubiquitin-like domain-containing protein n=1 Tax=Raphidocelis subcapitata TaxID=307507 RepID=A0A2V0P3W4_9CHLO|nr:hypothetical protein Rsub_06661 [Raphidocelis subcapitata]|eukprot:GBF94546.1 hypothetical protein Rsub_06661 [Raphidocelis subcapitata]